jgi:hypothetical protein
VNRSFKLTRQNLPEEHAVAYLYAWQVRWAAFPHAEFGEEGTPMYLSSQLSLNDSRGRCRAIEHSATFDDTIGLFKVYMQFKIVHDII